MTQNIQLALLTLSLVKKGFFCSAFPGKIVFGEITNYEYNELKSFVVFRHEFSKFFYSLSKIISTLCSEGPEHLNNVKELLTESKVFFWLLENKEESQNIVFQIEREEETYKTYFDLKEFYNFVHYFKELLYPSLLLKPLELKIFTEISNLSYKKILEMQNDISKIQDFTNKTLTKNDLSSINLPILILNNLDIILIVHKLRPFCKNEFLNSSLTLISKAFEDS